MSENAQGHRWCGSGDGGTQYDGCTRDLGGGQGNRSTPHSRRSKPAVTSAQNSLIDIPISTAHAASAGSSWDAVQSESLIETSQTYRSPLLAGVRRHHRGEQTPENTNCSRHAAGAAGDAALHRVHATTNDPRRHHLYRMTSTRWEAHVPGPASHRGHRRRPRSARHGHLRFDRKGQIGDRGEPKAERLEEWAAACRGATTDFTTREQAFVASMGSYVSRARLVEGRRGQRGRFGHEIIRRPGRRRCAPTPSTATGLTSVRCAPPSTPPSR